MTDELIRTAASGVVAALLGFELVAAVRSWYEARFSRRGEPGWRSVTARVRTPLLLSQSFAIRDHLAARRHAINLARRRYVRLRSNRYGRQLRAAIGRAQLPTFGEPVAGCEWCRASRLKGHAHCLECGRRLVVPVVPAAA